MLAATVARGASCFHSRLCFGVINRWHNLRVPTFRALRWIAPFLVSGGALAYVFGKMDLAVFWRSMNLTSAFEILGLVVLFTLTTLFLEAVSLRNVAQTMTRDLALAVGARIRLASYPLTLVHYTLGAGALSLLLSRRASTGIERAVGGVVLIALFDLGLLVGLTALSIALIATQVAAVQLSLVGAAALALPLGFWFLRSQRNLGLLERIRGLRLFDAARSAPTQILLRLAVLRLFFVLSFILLTGGALAAVDVDVPPGDLVVGAMAVALIAALPIAIAGVGPGQIAFVELFEPWGAPEELLACHLTLSLMLILVRGLSGFAFAGEYALEALTALRETES